MTVVARRTAGTWRDLTGAVREVTAPDAPQVVGAVAGQGQASVQWVRPDSGGSPITGYTITATPGGISVAAGASATTATLVGLQNDTGYSFTVRAANGHGNSPQSRPSGKVTPQASTAARIKPTIATTGIAGVGLTRADLTAYDCAVLGRDIPAGAYDRTVFVNIPVPGLRLMGQCTFTKCSFEGPANWPNPASGGRYLFNPSSAGGPGTNGHTFVDCVLDGGGVTGVTHYNSSATTPPKPFPASGNAAQNPFATGMTMSLIRCDVRHFEHLFQPSNNADGTFLLVDGCLFHLFRLVQYANDVTHVDGVQTAGRGVHDLTIQYCNFDLWQPEEVPPGALGKVEGFTFANTGSGGIFGGFPASPLVPKGQDGNAVAALVDIDIHHNWFDGGQYAWHLQKAAYNPSISTWLGSARNARIRDNLYGLHHKAIRDSIGTALDGTKIEWTNNTWEESGTTLSDKYVLAGEVIP